MRCISEFLAVLVALFVGVVPLRDCRAQDDGARGVVVLGDHAHHGHDHASGIDGHHPDDGCTETGTGHDERGCCLDAPFDTSVGGAAVSADRSIVGASNAPCLPEPTSGMTSSASSIAALSGAPPAPPDAPSAGSLGLASTVLLR